MQRAIFVACALHHCYASMSERGAICSRLSLALGVSIGAWLPFVACGGGGHGVSNTAQIPPAEEPPWTKAATVTPDAGAARSDGEERGQFEHRNPE
jgi:hypothetical protein